MKPKVRVVSQIRHRQTDWPPYELLFEASSGLEAQLDAHYHSAEWRHLLDNAIRRLPIPNPLRYDGPASLRGEYWSDGYGSLWRTDLRPPSLQRPALAERSLAGLSLPAVDKVFDEQWWAETRRVLQSQEAYYIVGSIGHSLFERAWMLRGFENALMDMVLDEEFCNELIDVIADHQAELLQVPLGLPIDGVMFMDDWGYQQGVIMGAERWRRIFKPRIARLYGQVHEAGKDVIAHCCGGIAEILPDLCEIGLDVYQSVQPEAKGNNPYDLKRRFGDKLAFWGGLGSQSIIPFCGPSDIVTEVHKLCAEMGRGGGYILGPAKPIQPGVPVENAVAVLEAFLGESGIDPSVLRQ